MMRNVLVIHASPAAVAPVRDYYAAHADSFHLVTILDHALLELLGARDYPAVEARIGELIAQSRQARATDAVLLTCSAVPREALARIRRAAGIPVVKIDDPMAEVAVRTGHHIGVLYTFAPTLDPTTTLLQAAAAEAGRNPVIRPRLAVGAYDALREGNRRRHDDLVIEAAVTLDPDTDLIVLAQVSMAHLAETIEARTRIRTLSSLDSSRVALEEVPVA